MDINAYLNRIKYSGPRTPTAETLRKLHRAHVLAVPFENLDVHLGRMIVLDEKKLFEKIVRQKRGGFCYELNGSFAALLRALGFKVTMLSARVYLNGKPGKEFDHMVLLVQLKKRWFADVGFGSLFIEPLRMDDKNEQIQRNAAYRIKQYGDIWKLMLRQAEDLWQVIYQFDLKPRQLQDYAKMCRWHQTSPRSWHTQNRVCTRATPKGRITLSGMKLVIRKGQNRTEQVLKTKKEYTKALKTYFGIKTKNFLHIWR
ncbi:MAG TPA: arylamine N-acetyltransferase [bacterium]